MDESTAPSDSPRLIAGRYAIEGKLGQGAVGQVFRVRDMRASAPAPGANGLPAVTESARAGSARADSVYALKRVRSDGTRGVRHRALLEREFHTLVQLQHPRIIEVYDYGLDDEGPYYTMELLDGDDLRVRGRQPWRHACALLRDVASSLAILHSRGLLHRDVSARNVRCTAEGRAKLIDFGAMVSMGAVKDVVGTPPFVAPEALQLQVLDARVDLFALGALGYFMLTGRNAFPARKLSELRDVWRTAPAPPHRVVGDVPEPLSRLVMQLLSLDRGARPDSAAEVLQRVCTIADLPLDENIEVSRSYLSTPALVGREREVLALRRRILMLARSEGGAVVIEGASGAGRSRLLDACVLEAKLVGATVVRASAADAVAGELGVLRALGEQLAQAFPDRAHSVGRLQADVLGAAIPALAALARPRRSLAPPRTSLPPVRVSQPSLGLLSSVPVTSSGMGSGPMPSIPSPPDGQPELPERGRLLRELRDFVIELARGQRLLIAVDDIEHIDELSAAWLAALAHKIDKHAIIVAVTASRDAESAAATPVSVLRTVATTVRAEPLDAGQTEALLRSVFGEVANLSLVAGRIHALSQGSPRTTMELAQHLVDSQLARYSGGAWSLPDQLDEGDLPSDLHATLAARVLALDPESRVLAEALAVTDGENVALDDYGRLAGFDTHHQLFRALDGLISARVVVADGERYRFTQRGYVTVLRDRLPAERRKQAHGRAAEVLIEREHNAVRVAPHLLLAGREREAVSLLCELDLASLPVPLSVLEEALLASERLQMPVPLQRQLRAALLGHASTRFAVDLFRKYLGSTFSLLERESGLSDYDALSHLPESERLTAALTAAQQRYESTPEDERGFSVIDAIRHLGRYSANWCAVTMQTYDLDALESLPSMAVLEPLSPALHVMSQLVQACKETLAGRTTVAREIYHAMLVRLAEPDLGGFEPSYHPGVVYAVHYLLGLVEASMGIATALDHASACDSNPEHRVNAFRIRLAYHLSLGNLDDARRAQRRAEMLQLQDSLQRYVGASAGFELIAHVCVGDLLGIKRTTEAVGVLAARFAGWRPLHALGLAHYRALQGDLRGALVALEPAHADALPGRHPYYPYIAAAQITWLSDLGEHEAALEVGRAHMASCERLQLSALDRWVKQAFATALARAGEHQEALRICERAIVECEAIQMQGISLASMYEARARIAIAMDDQVAFEQAVERCAVEYKKGRAASLSVRLARLMDEARKVEVFDSEPPPETAELFELTQTGTEHQTVQSMMLECNDDQDRARCALALILQGSTSQAAHLFAVRERGLVALASLPEGDQDPALLGWAQACLSAEIDSAEVTETETVAGGGAGDRLDDGPGRYVDARGQVFEALFLEQRDTTDSDSSLACTRIVALVALHVPFGLRTTPSKELLSEIAAQLVEHGDATGISL